MKILLDPQIFSIQNYGGISRYYTQIFNNLSKQEKIKITLPLVFSENVYLKDSILLNRKNSFIRNFYNTLNRIGISTRSKKESINRKENYKRLQKKEYDIFIPTYYDPYFLEFIGNKPFVLTVYDMIHELFPQYFIDDPFNVTNNKKILVHKASKIIAVSENTKRDILRFYPEVGEENIKVIYHGCSIKLNIHSKLELPENYLLFVGSRNYYKNFIFLIQSIKDLLNQRSDLYLVCAGGGDFNEEEVKIIQDLDLTTKVKHIHFEDNDLGTIYNKAKCFIFPSEYEGFGLPVLEAMQCECPVILPHSSSFPEVAGEAGVYYKLNDSVDLVNKIEKTLDNPAFRKEYIEKGKIQPRKFDWEKASNQCLELYYQTIKK
jgi:glycosyltransferase involved in cell wall biosynthesis